MEYDAITALWDKHPGWRLLRATNAPLVLTFLGHHFVEENQGWLEQERIDWAWVAARLPYSVA